VTTTRSKRPSCVWVSPEDIRGRIDASYFHHEYLSLDTSLAHLPKGEVAALDRLLLDPRRILYQKTTTFSADEAPEGAIPFVSGSDLDGSIMAINWSSVRYVERWMLEKYPKGRITDGSLLIKVKGPHQHTAYVGRIKRTALLSGTVLFAQVRGCNPFYLTAYLSCRQGAAWRSRLRTNTTVKFIGNDELRAVPVALPHQSIQDYIGTKVELAERCRALSAERWAEATTLLGTVLGAPIEPATFAVTSPSSVSAPGYQVASLQPVITFVSARRLNGSVGAQFFTPRRAKAMLVIEQGGLGAKRLREIADRFNKRATSDELQRLGLPYVGLAQIDSATGYISMDSQEQPTGLSTCFAAGDLLFSKLRPYLNKVAICPAHLRQAAGSTELVTYRTRPEVDAYYVYFVIKSPLVLNQVIDITSGSTHPRVDPDLIDDVVVPLAPLSTQRKIGLSVRAALELTHRATLLVDEAKADVEAFIDGSLDVGGITSGRITPPTFASVVAASEGSP
jgi:type I restriction enzyme, S subunit